MNNFTKEELSILKLALHEYLKGPAPIEAEHINEKVKSMIDNYCDHINAVIDEKLKCVYCDRISDIKLTKYKGMKVSNE